MEKTETVYTALFKEHWSAVFHMCAKRLCDPDKGKDVAEDCFLKLWENLERIEDKVHAKHFLYKCAANACFNQEETFKRRPTIGIDAVAGSLTVVPAEFDVIESDVIAFIKQEIELLSPARQKVIKLFFAGYTSNQIAAQTGSTQKTVLNHKLKVIDILKGKVWQKFGPITLWQ